MCAIAKADHANMIIRVFTHGVSSSSTMLPGLQVRECVSECVDTLDGGMTFLKTEIQVTSLGRNKTQFISVSKNGST